jgi:hypothetical protein
MEPFGNALARLLLHPVVERAPDKRKAEGSIHRASIEYRRTSISGTTFSGKND